MIKHTRIFSVIVLLTVSSVTNAQRFLQGIGLFISETSSRDKYINTYPRSFDSDPTFLHAKPPSHNSAEFENFGVGIYIEMLKSYNWRWVTEIEYCNTGATEHELLDPITNAQRYSVNQYHNIQWNNFLKRWIDLGLKRGRTYVMLGARLGYSMARSTPAYSYVSGAATPFEISGDAAVGVEYNIKGPWNWFIEEHYDRDILSRYTNGRIFMSSRMWETRLGIIYRFKAGIGAYDMDCNAPRRARQ